MRKSAKRTFMTITEKTLYGMAQQAALATCELLGVRAVVSYTQGAAKYGSFFKSMVKSGRLRPVYSGKGVTGKREYAIKDILALQAEEAAKAELL